MREPCSIPTHQLLGWKDSMKSTQGYTDRLNTQREAILQLLLTKRDLLKSQRVKRDGEMGRGRMKNGKKVASHFEIKTIQKVEADGIIKGWTEEQLNVSKAVQYNHNKGTFKVEKSGVYFLYCQVHFNENKSTYVKLVVSVNQAQKLQCMEGYGTTPASGSHLFHFLKPCQVSGLLHLEKGAEIMATTGSSFTLHHAGKHYFGLFKVN
ncbi:hypothetical protein MATL_G00167770 [Megalops atlanticus]|uniref:THD domain-containing protein n=1 Tax=Megalops atlanticus TaxID=7932 RepID=A0A9D3PNQ3_MEGAT|nr:hypothetical protein MATL_G00167770 [Megalops atlanticus]